MREHLGFLKISSVVVKIAAWIFLFFGILGSVMIFMGKIPGKATTEGVINLLASAFFFFFLFLIAKISDLLVNIINEIKKEEELLKNNK